MHVLPSRTEIERCYRILELDPDSSSTLVDASWRKLVEEWRPDRFLGDAVLHARAQTRVSELNRVHAILAAHLGCDLPEQTGPSAVVARSRSSMRRPMVGATAFAGVALAAVLIAHPSSAPRSRPAAPALGTVAPPPAIAVVRPPVGPAEARSSEILLIARAPLTVSVSLVADGRILLPDTTLHAGQTTGIPRLGPTYIKYSAGENLEVEIDGHRFAMPTPGASRAKVN